MYRVIMDFDCGEMRIPMDVAQALDMPPDFSYLVHRGNRQMVITRNSDPSIAAGEKRRGPAPHKSRIAQYWHDDANAYCITVKNGMQQIIGNLISGFNGSGVYALDGSVEQAFGDPVVVFDLGHAVPEADAGSKTCKWCGKELLPRYGKKKTDFCDRHCYDLWWHSGHKKRTEYHRTCPICGKTFVVCTNKRQKYCSAACYQTARKTNGL